MSRVALPLTVAVLLAFVGAGAASTKAFKPAEGRYSGDYTSSNHGTGKVRLEVGTLRADAAVSDKSRHDWVRLVRWSGKLRCPGHRTQRVGTPMTAARIGRTFNGYMMAPDTNVSLVGGFTSRTALRGTVRITQGTGDERCDTGPVTFLAHRVGP